MPPADALLNQMTIREAVPHFFSKLGFFVGFSLYIIIITGRNSDAAMGGARGVGGAKRPVLGVNELKKDGCTQRIGAYARLKPTSEIKLSLFRVIPPTGCILWSPAKSAFSRNQQTEKRKL